MTIKLQQDISIEKLPMPNPDGTNSNRALTYTEMMNEGKQTSNAENHRESGDLEERVNELERKVEHLQKIIQRQLRLGRMIE